MCEFMDALGWFSMSPSEQWDVFLKILGLVGASFAAWWTISRWYLAKKIEIEITLLELLAKGRAEFYNVKNSSTVDKATKLEFQKYYDDFTKDTKRILKEKLRLGMLRRINRETIAKVKFILESIKILEKS